MTIGNGQLADVVEGVVDAVNPHGTGVRLGGTWYSVSKFMPVDLPARGARVRLQADAKGFIRSVEVLDQVVGAGAGPRDRTSVRLSVLTAAAAFAASKAVAGVDVKSTDVLKIAEAFERWVLANEES